MENTLFGKDIIGADSISKEEVKIIFDTTREMGKIVKSKGGDDRLKGKVMAALFFEPSTRTFSSFITAMQRLGGGIIPLNGMQNTSIAKGESFEHTIKVFSRYADCIVIRHNSAGKPQTAADCADIPVINAGDGGNEHPTQGLFDSYTILDHFGSLDGLIVSLVGDLTYGRTVHSLSQILAKIDSGIRFNFVSPPQLKMPDMIKSKLKNAGVKIMETERLAEVINVSDVIYMTRVQKERFTDVSEYEKLKSFYELDRNSLMHAKRDMIVMHPLPIAAGEINKDLDADKRAVYLNTELTNGLHLRMALLDLILRKIHE